MLGALLSAGLIACSGDTLYDEGGVDVPGPDVRILDPTGGQAQTGRPVRIIVQASDTLGVAEIEISYRGVATGVLRRTYSPPRLDVVLDTVLQLPASGVGSLELQATSRNGLGATGRSDEVTLNVVGRDELPPFVSLEVETPPRMELDDSIDVRITARDNPGGSGLVRVGLTVLVTSPGGSDTTVVQRSQQLGEPASGTVTVRFQLPPPGATAQNVPRTLELEYFAIAIDEAGNCGAAVRETEQALPCAPLYEGQPEPLIAGAPGLPGTTIAVSGTSVDLPSGAIVPDAAVDVQRQRLYLPSLDRSRIEVLDLATRSFRQPVLVGSEPWGVALNRTSDTLLVANSGGTNISYIPLSTGTLTEDVGKRIRTPNSVIFLVSRTGEGDEERLNATFVDFSDRPQHLAQDAFGRIIYSTKPTPAAPDGTIRLATREPGWQQAEVRLIFDELATEEDSALITIAHVDSLRVFVSPGSRDRIEIYDHVPGFPNSIVRSGILPIYDAIQEMIDLGSDIIWANGRFAQEFVGLRDTTFVVASGDRRRIAIGEGARLPGRIVMWNAPTASISNEITIADLVGNASENITGVGLNQDGTLNVLRGSNGAYFFKEDLRLQGTTTTPLTAAGSGAQLHPQHPSYAGFPNSGASTLAFVAAGDAIRIVDTVHFNPRGEIPVRDRITGPIRVSPPLAGETGACPGPDCVVAKLYGVTNAGTVVIVNVRTRDIN